MAARIISILLTSSGWRPVIIFNEMLHKLIDLLLDMIDFFGQPKDYPKAVFYRDNPPRERADKRDKPICHIVYCRLHLDFRNAA
jgi:hypothetical protein